MSWNRWLESCWFSYTPQAPHLTYRLSSYFYSTALWFSTITTTVAITYIAYYCYVTLQGIFNYEIHLAIASCMHCYDQPFAYTALLSWHCSIMSTRLVVHDIKVRQNSELSGKVHFTLHILHTLLVRCVCLFIEVIHIEHYCNKWKLYQMYRVLQWLW